MSTTLFMLCCMLLRSQAQKAGAEFDVKFGSITPAEFQLPTDAIVPKDASAFVIADFGSADVEGHNNGSYSLIFKRRFRIKVLNQQGLNAADLDVMLFQLGGKTEQLSKVKAICFNLDNGVITKQELDKKNIFTTKVSPQIERKQFKVPGVKVGSVIDVSYTIESDMIFNYQPWDFQSKFPCYWSQYTAAIPDFLNYVKINKGEHKYHYTNSKEEVRVYTRLIPSRNEVYANSYRKSVSANVRIQTWVMKNVPAFEKEPFAPTELNENARIEFKLSRLKLPGRSTVGVLYSWPVYVNAMLESERFGAFLQQPDTVLRPILQLVITDQSSQKKVAEQIYNYVQANYQSEETTGIWASQSLTEFLNRKKGAGVELNLFMCALLNAAGIEAYPAIISTTENGRPNPLVAMLEEYNHCVVVAKVDSTKIELDVSSRFNCFGFLPANCFNLEGRIINPTAAPYYFSKDSILEKRLESVFVNVNDSSGFTVSVSKKLGKQQSWMLRQIADAVGSDTLLEVLQKAYFLENNAKELTIDNLADICKDISLHYSYHVESEESKDLFILFPFKGLKWQQNPFIASERKLPIELDNRLDETFIANIEIPEGFVLDEWPKNEKVYLNEEDGVFEYLVGKVGTKLLVKATLKINKTWFDAEEYASLRNFYAILMKKMNEAFVIKKKEL